MSRGWARRGLVIATLILTGVSAMADTGLTGSPVSSFNDPWVGRELPSVKLDSSAGGSVMIPKDLQGKWTVLYFYPKDDTPGCTKQACSYRDHLGDFKKLGVELYGVSLDDLRSHSAFINKFGLNFPLLADTKHELSGPLGVFGEQQWQGKKFSGLSRDTFLVDPQGKIQQVWRKVKPETTIEETYQAVKARVQR